MKVLLKILGQLILWLVSALVYWLMPIALVAVIVFLILKTGDKLVPVSIIVFRLYRTLKTVVFLDIRKFSDGTSTFHRMYRPQDFNPNMAGNWSDQFSLMMVERIPTIRKYSDMGRYPLSYGLTEVDSKWQYLWKSLPWNVCSIGACVVWWLGVDIIIIPYVLTTVGTLCIVAKRIAIHSAKSDKYAHFSIRRIKVINRYPLELLESLTFGVMTRTGLYTKPRLKLVTLGFWLSWLQLIIYILVRGI